MRRALCAAALAAAADAMAAPGFAAGFVAKGRLVVSEQKAANKIRQERKAGALLEYEAWDRLQVANEDIGKVINVVWFGVYLKLWTPVALAFYPGMLPSAWETPKRRVEKFAALEKARRKGLDGLIKKVDGLSSTRPAPKPKDLQPDQVAAFVDVLGAASKKQAVKRAVSAEGGQLPRDVLVAASRALDGPYGFSPRWMHRRAVRKGVETLKDGDAALRRSNLDELPTAALERACAARGALKPTRAEMRRALDEWLAICDPADAADDPRDADATRLALLLVNTVGGIRRRAPRAEPALALLYAGGGY